MTTYPLRLESLSFNDLKTDLLEFVQTKPDASRWKDFYEGSEGTIIIELVAGLGFYEAMKIIFGAESTYLQYATTLETARAVAQNLLYSSYRGANRRYTLKVTPDMTVSIPAMTPIGVQGEYDVVTTKDYVFNKDEEIEIEVVVGTYVESQIQIPSNELRVFRFLDSNISEDYVLFLNDKQVSTTSIAREILNDNYYVQTNASGGVNISYFNQYTDFKQKYTTGDILTLKYMQYEDVAYSKEFIIDYVTSENLEIISTINTNIPESVESIQVKAPALFESQQLIRSRTDYEKVVSTLNTKFTQVKGRDLSPAYIELAYVLKDQSLLTFEQKEEIKQELELRRFFGIPLPYLADPLRTTIKLDIHLQLSTSSAAILAEYTRVINDMLLDYQFKLNSTLDLIEIRQRLDKLEGVRQSTVSVVEDEFQRSSWYELGNTIKVKENTYRVCNFTYKSGETEPTWITLENDFVLDNEIVWEIVPLTGHPAEWEPKKGYKLCDTVVTSLLSEAGYMARMVEGKNISNVANPPTWSTEIGSLTYDENLIWMAIPKVETAEHWEPNTWFNPGNIIKTGDVSQQVVAIRKKSTNMEPEYSGDEAPEYLEYHTMVLRKEDIPNKRVPSSWSQYFVIDATITAGVY